MMSIDGKSSTGASGTTYQVGGDESFSEAIVKAIAKETGRAPTVRSDVGGAVDVLDPLYECIEPDALDALLATAETHTQHGPTKVTFSYSGYQVTASSTGSVHVKPAGHE